jgi:hypothetical protein
VKTSLLVAALGWLCCSGCTISAVSEALDNRPRNECSVDEDCSRSNEGCNGGMCQPNDGELEALLIEVTPPSDSGAPHLSFVSHLDAIPTSGGELKLPAVRAAKVTGSLRLAGPDACYPTLPQKPVVQPQAVNLSLPITATLIPRERLLGLPQQLYVAAGGYQLDGTYKFELDVPPGKYDVYIVPDRGQTGCVVPPQLFRGEEISAPTKLLDYKASHSPPLELSITWPKGARTLDGWTVDIIEPIGGKPISTEVTLGDAFDADPTFTTVEYRLKLVYSTVSRLGTLPLPEDVKWAHDLVRLRPPEGEATPTIVFDRSGLGLLSKSANITGFTRYPSPVTVEGQLASAEDGRPLIGAVTVVSTAISGIDEGITASFQRSVQLDAQDNGIFSIELPPGAYRVHAVADPRSDGGVAGAGSLAALVTTWEVAAGVKLQAGKLLELPRSSYVSGRSRFEGAEVRIAASPQNELPFLEALGRGEFTPRGRNGLVESGRFAIGVDPGLLDIWVRPPEELGFGWYVEPGVEIAGEDYDVGAVPLRGPSVLRGTTIGQFVERSDVVVTRPVAACSVRAYAYLDKDSVYTRNADSAVSVVQVAETRSDESGAFRLLVPPRLDAPK